MNINQRMATALKAKSNAYRYALAEAAGHIGSRLYPTNYTRCAGMIVHCQIMKRWINVLHI